MACMDWKDDVIKEEPCGPCRKKATNEVPAADWFCKECDDFICDECKDLHHLFKPMENHNITTIRHKCQPCFQVRNQVNAYFFCEDCKDFLCDECSTYHKLFPATEAHHTVSIREMLKRNQTSTNTQVQNPSNNNESHTAKTPLSKCKTKLVTEIDFMAPGDTGFSRATGLAFLPDSRLLMVDRLLRLLKLYDVNYNFVLSKQFSRDPYDVAVYDSSEVAVTVGSDIVRFSVNGNDIKEQGKISPGFECSGVSYISRNKLAVTGALGDRGNDILYVYNTDGTQLSRFNLEQGIAQACYVTVDKDRSRAYVSVFETSTVCAVDLLSGKIEFSYNAKILPLGVTLDKDHNLYVCSIESNEIHQVSPAGELIQILKIHKHACPQTISFAPSGDTFVACGTSKMFVYKMVEQSSCTCM